MERKEILTALNGIFSVVLNKENMQLDESMSTDELGLAYQHDDHQ